MRYTSLKTFSHSALATTIAILTSCTIMPPTIKAPVNTPQGGWGISSVAGESRSYASEEERQKDNRRLFRDAYEKMKTKQPYTGPIQVSIDTGIGYAKSQGRQMELSQALSQYENKSAVPFSVQALPEGEIVFQERLTKETGPLTVSQSFSVADTSQVYTLHVQNGDEQGDNTVSSAVININGHDWLRPNDFKGKNTPEISKNSLLLNSQNTMNININGKPGSSCVVTVVKAGAAGVVRRTNGPLNEHPTQSAHTKGHDQNIFDPTDVSSLGDLEALSGDQAIGDGQRMISAMQVNGTDDVEFESGYVVARFENDAKRDAFLALYHAEVAEVIGDYYRIKLDLSRSPVLDLVNLLRTHDVYSPGSIQGASFSSLQSLQTFTIVLDSLINHNNLVQSIGLDQVDEQTIVDSRSSTTQPFSDWTRLDTNPNNFGVSWWLSDTRTPEAWNYSIGTGVTAAILDIGFSSTAPDIDARRYILNVNNAPGSVSSIDDPKPGSDKRETTQYHGHYCVMTAFAERDNGMGGVGVAPNSKVIPYTGQLMSDRAKAILDAKKNGAQVISTSIRYKSFEWYYFIPFVYPSILVSEDIIRDALLAAPVVPFVVSAMNDSTATKVADLSVGFPQRLGKDPKGERFSFVIPVGAVEPYAGSDRPQTRIIEKGNIESQDRFINIDNSTPNALSSPTPPTFNTLDSRADLQISGFSNYESQNMVWAPGEYIYVADRTGSAGPSTPKWYGTSASAPFVNGVISLMLSVNPSLTADEIEEILINTSRITVDANGKPGDVKMVDVKNAVLAADDTAGGSSYAATEARAFIGVIQGTGNNKKLLLNTDLKPSSFTGLRSFELRQTTSDLVWNTLVEGQVVKVLGWNNVSRGRGSTFSPSQLETMNVDPVCSLTDAKYPSSDPRYSLDRCATSKLNAGSMNLKDLSGTPIATIDKTNNQGFRLEIEGDNFMANTLKKIPLQVIFKEVSGVSEATFHFNFAETAENISNDGRHLTLVVDPNNPDDQAGYAQLVNGTYNVLVRGATGEDFGTTSTGFTVTGTGLGAGTPPGSTGNVGSFGVQFIGGENPVEAEPGDNLGVAVVGDKTDMTVNIGGIDVPVLAVVNDLIAFGIPNNVPQGIQDVIISAAGGSITFENAVRILGPQPSPTPSSSGNPSSGSVRVVVSNSLSPFFTAPFEPNLFSVLTLQQDSFGNSARWLGLPPGQTGTISYPKVPDIRNPGSVDNELPLQIDFQVAHNETQGGTITVSSGNEVVTFPGTEGQVMTQVFPFAASESSARSVTFQLSGTDPNAQIVFVIKAKP